MREMQQSQMLVDDDDNYSNTSHDSDDNQLLDNSENENANTEKVDPFLSAIDDLAGQVIAALDNFKLHSGQRSSQDVTIHTELQDVLRPVVEVAAHVGPATARSHASFRPNVEFCIEEIYGKLNSDLILPLLLESAQSEMNSMKRAAALQFFVTLYREYKSSKSYLDPKDDGLYGTLSTSEVQRKQRFIQRNKKIAETLRYWIEASTACTIPGAFSDLKSDGAVASRAVISASSVVRPALKLVAEKISSADDAGALRAFIPVMRMIGGVLRRLFTSQGNIQLDSGEEASLDSLRSACIKFLEIVVRCFSTRFQSGKTSRQKGGKGQGLGADDFALDDLPIGHPIITRQSLGEIGEEAFRILRGFTMVGGNVKVETSVMRYVMLNLGLDANGNGGTPTAQVLAILRPVALSYLEIEESLNKQITQENPFPKLDRDDILIDYQLGLKSYVLTINAISALASRPAFFKDSASCLALRAMDPPTLKTKSSTKSIQMHLKASMLTLLRNSLSIASGSSTILHAALSSNMCDMKIQASKALNMAKNAAALKTAGRAERNRAAIYYQWDTEMQNVSKKRQRAGDDALESMRAAKAARGLGNGIKMPTSMVDACELVLINLSNLPPSRGEVLADDVGKKTSQKDGDDDSKKKKALNLDSFIDVILTNGASLARNESLWYTRDGGTAWTMNISSYNNDREEASEASQVKASEKRKYDPINFSLDNKTIQAGKIVFEEKDKKNDDAKLFRDQCKAAASDSFQRIVTKASSIRDPSLADFGNKIAARLAWTLKDTQPSTHFKEMNNVIVDELSSKKVKDEKQGYDTISFMEKHPLVLSCFAMDMETTAQNSESTSKRRRSTLAKRVLHEGYMHDISSTQKETKESTTKKENPELYKKALDTYIISSLIACRRTDAKPNDKQRKILARESTSSLLDQLASVPTLTPSALELTSYLCEIEEITKKANESARKENLASSGAAHAAKVAGEERATGALRSLRDAAFQYSKPDIRKSAIECAVGIAAARFNSTASIEDKALKLVMNVIYPKAADLADHVVSCATDELERVAKYAIENNPKIQKANEEVIKLKGKKQQDPFKPLSDVEKEALAYVKKPVVLFMALVVRRLEIIKTLMRVSNQEGADVVAKAVRNNMSKLVKAAAMKYGHAQVARQVADLTDENETLLLCFLDNLTPIDAPQPTQDLIDACHDIQTKRLNDGKKDARYIIPIVPGMKRCDLVEKLHEFVSSNDVVFKAALSRMSERLGRQSLRFREEVDTENSSLVGMTLCEQIVFLHRIDFAAKGLPQKRYLDAIRICLEDETFTDRVIMAALEYISGTFLEGESLPLAFMRTIILCLSYHESLHSWICHVLLPRLIEGKVYQYDKRQWEGWMRCAAMLENAGSVSSAEAIQALPTEQYRMYRSKYPQKN